MDLIFSIEKYFINEAEQKKKQTLNISYISSIHIT
jgi:hypothetical protein